MKFKKRHLLTALAVMLVVGFGLMLEGTYQNNRHHQWLGLGFALSPVLAVGVWLLKHWVRHWIDVDLQHKKELARARQRAADESELGRIIDWSGTTYYPTQD